jgi:fructose-bisphosphate aldolase class I
MTTLEDTARELVAPGRGILAADESTPTITKRFEKLGIVSTEESRRRYRELLLTAPGLEDYISGVILYDETIRQADSAGTPFPEVLAKRGIMPGIKVDTGAKDLAGAPGEKVTEGLDGLRERLAEYRAMGARFAKWRAVIAIGDGLPSRYCIKVNAHALGRYAALCQEAGIVPVVEPEVLMDGDHTIERCYEATMETLRAVFAELAEQRVVLEGMLLKANMAISGKDCPHQAGQSNELATAHLNAMNRLGPHPWELSFSYARALQGPAIETWRGDDERYEDAQSALVHRARLNSEARYGRYEPEMEQRVGAA